MRMHKKCLIALLLCLTVIVCACGCSKAETKTETTAEKEPSVIRIGCFNSGEYFYYRDEIVAIASSLQDAGWIEGFDAEKERETTKEAWDDLSACTSEYLEFVPEIYYEKYFMSDEELEVVKNIDDVDLMLCIGSLAGGYLTEVADDLSYDYIVTGVADSISAGFVKSETERVNDKSTAVVDKNRISRQLEAAYEIFQFKSVGVVYEDIDAAYSYSGIRQLEEMSEKYGFEIHRLHVKEAYTEDEYDRYYTELKAAYEELIPQIDTLYITTATIEDDKLPWLLSDVIDAGIVTVAETSESQVEYGAMMHITATDAMEEGNFVSERICEYAYGVPITEMEMKYEVAPRISLNSTTIKKTGVKIPFETYLVADKIYD